MNGSQMYENTIQTAVFEYPRFAPGSPILPSDQLRIPSWARITFHA
jgi:hypothetical protein